MNLGFFFVELVRIETAAAIGVIGAILGFAIATAVIKRFGNYEDEVFDPLEDADGFTMRPVEQTGDDGLFGVVGRWWRSRKKKQALKKGYVKWHIISDSISEPKYVRPKCKEGGDIPEVDHEGGTYLFPESAMVPSADDGVWTVMHYEGQAEPVNLRDTSEDAIGANSLREYLTMRVSSKSPGLGLGLGDMSTGELMKYAIFGFIGLVILMEVMGGGLL